jgi:hypothetical protein
VTARKLVKVAQCSVCNHPERARVEFGRVSGQTLDSLALQFPPLSRDAIWRHCETHLSDDQRSEYLAAVPLKELATKAAAESVSVLEHYQIIRASLMASFQLCASIGDRPGMSALAGRLNEILRSMATLSGEMGSLAASSITINNNLNVLNSPIFANIQAQLLTALSPFPEARAAVVAALRQIDQQQAPTMKTIEHFPLAESAFAKDALDATIENSSAINQ